MQNYIPFLAESEFHGHCFGIHVKKKQDQNQNYPLQYKSHHGCFVPGSTDPPFPWVERFIIGLRLSET